MEEYSFADKDKIVSDLQSYLKECQNDVTNILEAVGWTPEHFVKQEDIVSCSFDSSHRMPRQCLPKHEEKCELLYVGYRKEDLDDVIQYSQISESFPRDTKIHLDKDTMNRVLRDHHVKNQSLFFAQDRLPLTPDEFAMQLTPSERASIYNYVVMKAKEGKKSTDQSDNLLSADLQEMLMKKEADDKNKPKSYIEYLQAERDYKRRRQSYRAKNVHITRKSYTEIIREVIQNQTEYVSELRQEEAEQRAIKHEEESTQQPADFDLEIEYSDENENRGREKVKKKKKHKKHKHQKHKHRSRSLSRSPSRSTSRTRSSSRTEDIF